MADTTQEQSVDAPVAAATVEGPPPAKRKLYDSMVKDKLYTKSFDAFNTQFSTPDKVNNLHSFLTQKGKYDKDANTFGSQFFSDVVKKKGPSEPDSNSGSPTSTEPSSTSQPTDNTPQPASMVMPPNAIAPENVLSSVGDGTYAPAPYTPQTQAVIKQLENEQIAQDEADKKQQASNVMQMLDDFKNKIPKAPDYKQNDPTAYLDYLAKQPKAPKEEEFKGTIGDRIALGALTAQNNLYKGLGTAVTGLITAANFAAKTIIPANEAIEPEEWDKARDNLNAYVNKFTDGLQWQIEPKTQEQINRNPLQNAVNQVANFVPAAIASESTAGQSFYYQGVGDANNQIQELKAKGVEIDPGVADLYTQLMGIGNYYLMNKLNAHSLLSTFPAKLRNSAIGRASAETIKTLADKGADATGQDIVNVFKNPIMGFGDKVAQLGLDAVKSYGHTAVDLAGLATYGHVINAGANAANEAKGGDEIFHQNPSDLIAQYRDILTSSAPAFTLFGAARTVVDNPGLLFHDSPYHNIVTDRLQKDSSPENIQRIKDDLATIGAQKQWSQDDILNSQNTVDMVADVASKLPRELRPDKFRDGVDLITHRRALETVLKETKAQKTNLDPAVQSRVGPFEDLLNAKIDQANDKLSTLVTDKGFTYYESNGQYFKKQTDGEPVEITKARYDLEDLENEYKPKATQSIVMPVGSTDKAGNPIPPKVDKDGPLPDNTDISDEDYNKFVDQDKVSPENIDKIAVKVKDKQPLSEREKAIFASRTEDINKSIKDSLQPEVAPKPKADGQTSKATPAKAENTEKPAPVEQPKPASTVAKVDEVVGNKDNAKPETPEAVTPKIPENGKDETPSKGRKEGLLKPENKAGDNLPALSNEQEADRHWLENETNPEAIASRYHQDNFSTENSADYKEHKIAEAFGTKSRINARDFSRFGDDNLLAGDAAFKRRWIDMDNKSQDIDQVAQELTHNTDVEFTPQDIVDFITKYRGKGDFEAKATSGFQTDLEHKYHQLTGKNLSKKAAEEAYNKSKAELSNARLNEDAVEIIDKEGINYGNIDKLRDMFKGFPYSEDDFNNVKRYLENERKQGKSEGESGKNETPSPGAKSEGVRQSGKETGSEGSTPAPGKTNTTKGSGTPSAGKEIVKQERPATPFDTQTTDGQTHEVNKAVEDADKLVNLKNVNPDGGKSPKRVKDALGDADKLRFEELRKKLKQNIRSEKNDIDTSGDMSSGYNAELYSTGIELTSLYFKAGVHGFADYAREMISDMGEDVIPYLGSFYEGAKRLPGVKGAFDSTDTVDYHIAKLTETGDPVRVFVDRVKSEIAEGNKLNILRLEGIADEAGLSTDTRSKLQDHVELALMEVARDITDNPMLDDKEKFEELIKLYESQPSLLQRSSTSVALQQYSTPLPYSFAAGTYINDIAPGSIYDPTAGTGNLTIAFNPAIASVNEIDPGRLEILRQLGFAPTGENAITFNPGRSFAGIMTNPPFGPSGTPVKFHDYVFGKLDYIIPLRALESMKDDGRAAIIIGGHNQYDKKILLGTDFKFLNYLYHYYNVSDVINVDGGLYAKQGTTFPTRLILVNGRKEVPAGYAPVEDEEANKPVKTYEQLYNRVQERIKNDEKPTVLQSKLDVQPQTSLFDDGTSASGVQTGRTSGSRAVSNTSDNEVDRGRNEKQRTGDTTTGRQAGLERDVNRPDGDSEGDNEKQQLADVPEPIAKFAPAAQSGSVGPETAGEFVPNDRLLQPARPSASEVVKQDKIAYSPSSRASQAGSVIPANMAYETEQNLKDLENLYGPIDAFVANELDYHDLTDLNNAFFAEQIDAIGLAIHQLKNGQGMIVGDMTGIGKGRSQPLTAKILTKNGFITMGEVKIGDKIISVDGKETSVVGIFPQGVIDVYEVEFMDGTKTECSGDHLWLTQNKQERDSKSEIYKTPKVRTTLEIIPHLKRSVTVPIVSPVEFEKQEVDIDPYILGIILGDGCIRKDSVQIVMADAEILKAVSNLVHEGLSPQFRGRYHYDITNGKKGKQNKLMQALKKYNLTGKVAEYKFIPEQYRINSVECRIAILQGLMDSDGYVNKDGSCLFYSVSNELADDVEWIVQSLGGTASRGIKKTTHLDCHVVYLKLPNEIIPFRLLKKAERVKVRLKYPPKKYFKSITLIGQKECQCIKVDHPTSLYVTDDFIVTHNTAAGLLRWAVNQGHTPTFFTENADLFSDIYRDLHGIGSGHLIPFIVNDPSGDRDANIKRDGKVIYKANKIEDKRRFFETGKLPAGTNIVLSTYSQLNSEKQFLKRGFITKMTKGSFMFLDESHNVSGDSNSGKFFQDLLAEAKGATFFSATYAKRPDNMPVYALKTAMQDANMTTGALVEAIQTGGNALQEVVSSQLVKAGQMIRRERDFTDVVNQFDTIGTDKDGTVNEQGQKHRELADQVIEVCNSIITFEKDFVEKALGEVQAQLAKEGKRTKETKSKQLSVSNTPFASKMFNIVNQMLFSIKAPDIARIAIEELKAGNKPVIAFNSTMESFIKNNGYKPGDEIDDVSFSASLLNGLKNTLKYRVEFPNGDTEVRYLSLDDLDDEGRASWNSVVDMIKAASAEMSISPIDTIHEIIEAAGYKAGEITGRASKLKFSEDGKSAMVESIGKKDTTGMITDFNGGGATQAILLNAAGATGFSMHADKSFRDQRERVMITGQLELDINKEIQKRGRIDRTNQVRRGRFRYVVSSIPAETRLLMMFRAKLKSLQANTTSSQKSKANDVDVVDFLNEYGDQVITDYLQQNPDTYQKLYQGADPAGLRDIAPGKTARPVEGIARKSTGRAALLTVDEQERFYNEVSQAYNDYIDYLNSIDQNTLEIKSLNLEAETLSKGVYIEGKHTNSPFGQDSMIEKVEANVLRKPLSKVELEEQIDKALDGKTPTEASGELMRQVTDNYKTIVKRRLDNARELLDKRVKKDAEKYASNKALMHAAQKVHFDEFDKAEEEITNDADQARDKMVAMFRDYKVGTEHMVPTSIYGTEVKSTKGIFLGFSVKDENIYNKFTPSNILMKFAVLDGKRIISATVSRADFVNALYAAKAQMSINELRDMGNLRNHWDEEASKTKDREIRHIITGNILQAFKPNMGQLASYTTSDGKIHKGIIMPKSFDPQLEGQLVGAVNMHDKIMSLINGESVLSSDGSFEIQKYGNGYQLNVPRATSKGGRYFKNQSILDLVNYSEFDTRNGKMVAGLPGYKMMDLLKVLEKEFNMKFKSGVDMKDVNPDPGDKPSGGGGSKSSKSSSLISNDSGELEYHEQGQDFIHSKSTERIQAENHFPAGRPIKKLPEIISDLAKGLNVKIFHARSARKGAAGSYNPTSAGIKLKAINNLDVAVHEVGHALDDAFDLFNNIPAGVRSQVMDELQWFADRGGSNPPASMNAQSRMEYLKREGIAEFVRAYTINPAQAFRRAPEFFAHFEATLPDDVKEVLHEFGNDYLRYNNGTNLDRIMANIEELPKEQQSGFRKFLESFKTNTDGNFNLTFWDNVKTKFTNGMRPFDKGFNYLTMTAGHSMDNVLPEENASMLAQVFAGVDSKIGAIFADGLVTGKNEPIIDARTGRRMNMEWLYDAFDSTSPETLAQDQALTIGYLFAMRTVEKSMQFDRPEGVSGISASGTENDIDVAVNFLTKEFGAAIPREQRVRILEGARRYQLWSDKMLKYMVDKGRLSQANYRSIKNNNLEYVAFLPVQENEPGVETYFDSVSSLNRRASMGSVKTVIKEMQGSTMFKRHPYVSLLQNTAAMIKEADRNEILQSFIEPMLSTMRNMGQGSINPFANVMMEVTQAEKTPGKPVMSVYVNGNARYFMFSNDAKDIYEVVNGLTKLPQLPGLVTAIPNAIRFGVTRFPVFAMRNVIRDTFSRLIISRSHSGFGSFLKDRGNEKELFKLFGGDQAGYYMGNKLDYYKLQNQVIKDLTHSGKATLANPVELTKKGWHWYENLLQKGELTNRMAEFRASYTKAITPKVEGGLGLDEYNANLWAAYQARDLMDFAAAGTWMRYINLMVPFANAQVQGLKREFKAATENGWKGVGLFAMKLALFTILPQLLMRMLAKIGDYEEEYDNLPSYQRDIFWSFKLPNGGWFIIPKPFSTGLPAAGIDRAIGSMEKHENAWSGYPTSLYQNLSILRPEMMAGPMSAAIEPMANYSFFKQGPIVPRFEENKLLELRKKFNTASRLSKGMSLMLSPAFKDGDSVDPRYIDNLFTSMFSYYGETAMNLSDIGSKESRQKFGLKTTGFIRDQQIYGDVRVSKLYDVAEDLGLTGSSQIKRLTGYITDYYNSVTPAERKESFKVVMDYAKDVYHEWMENNIYKEKVETKGHKINFN